MNDRDFSDRERYNANLWELRLTAALNAACNNQTAIIIIPPSFPKHYVVNRLAQLLASTNNPLQHALRATQDSVHFEGLRGQVRVYHSDHYEYDAKLRHFRGYSHDTPTFLHPEVEGL